MLLTIQGIVLRSIKYSETSVICDVYTRELGLRTYIASGVRSKKSKISPNWVRPMALIEAVVYHREKKDINRLKEVKPLYIYDHVSFQVKRGAIGLFITEILQKTIKETEVNEDLFDFLLASYQVLDALPDDALNNFHLGFMVKLAPYLGILPEVSTSKQPCFFDYQEGSFEPELPTHIYHFDAEHSQWLIEIEQTDLTQLKELGLRTAQRRAFLDNLLKFYEYHIENFGNIHAHLILQEVLS